MSVSLLLIPAALAGLPAVIGAAANARTMVSDALAGGPDGGAVRVRTRMKDIGLLAAAAEQTGGTVLAADEERLTVNWPQVRAEFSRDSQGIWSAHFEGPDAGHEAAADLLQRLDDAYARQVQQALVQRLKDRADGAGLQLQSEKVEEDETVTLVLNVRS